MNRRQSYAFAGICAAALAATVSARPDVVPNNIVVVPRLFNDYPSSELTITNNYPSDVTINERNFGSGGFANRHTAWWSTDNGATPHGFGYADAFDLSFTVDLDASPAQGREAGFHSDLFGLGIFGVLPNGEIASFGSILPFQSFGNVWTPGTATTLRMIHRPGDGDGTTPGSIPSTIEYFYDTGSGPVSSGLKPFTNTEQGIPAGFSLLLGFGVQNAGGVGGESNAVFTNFAVPGPGAGLGLGLFGLLAVRRRRA